MKTFPAFPDISFGTAQKKYGKSAANNGSADTQCIRFVRKGFVFSV